jgi:hypothetical protein
MRTKTLLVACAALALSLATSQAQVYSQNIVGYVNIPLTNGVLQVVAPALDLDGTGTNNTVATVLGDPTLGDILYIYNGSGYDVLTYANPPRGAGLGWYNGSVLDDTYPLNPGEAIFYLPAGNETITQTGNVLEKDTHYLYAGTLAFISSPVPVAGGVTSVLQYSPNLGDVIDIYNGVSYDTYIYANPPRGAGLGWYLGPTLNEPQIPIASGFWIIPAADNTWTQSFSF